MAVLVPQSFERKKQRILQALAVPDSEYTDLSPKGSVDVQIRELIDEINAVPSLVTTSSCSGRVSVFVQGRKGAARPKLKKQEQGSDDADAGVEADAGQEIGDVAGHWLYVSHDPIDVSVKDSWHSVFGLDKQSDVESNSVKTAEDESSLIHFKFEPMVSLHNLLIPSNFLIDIQILHLQAASLHMANIVLAAANQAGFRESGAMNLAEATDNDDGSKSTCPAVAIRSMGLGFDSVIGFHSRNGSVSTFVDENQLSILVRLANERFATNVERTQRFAANLRRALSPLQSVEDEATRRQRKRAEGLKRQLELQSKRQESEMVKDEDSMSDRFLGLDVMPS
jgi:tRNA wybutosine-synthesizing protein 3